MNKLFALLLGILIVTVCTGTSRAQSLEDNLVKFGQDYSKGYFGPVGTTWGAAMNSGWYSTADVSDGIDLFIGVRLMAMPVPDDSKTFNIASIWTGKVQQVPTFFGNDNEVAIDGAGGHTPDTYAKGINFGYSLLPVPQISAGNIFGTRLMLRFLPEIKIGDAGKISTFGLGVQHSLNRYIPMLPLELAGMAAYQHVTMGDIIKANSFTFGAEASKSFAILTLYGGVAYETSTFSLSYNAQFSDPANPGQMKTVPVGFDVSGKNTIRLTLGFALGLGPVKINADYSVASQPVITAGFGFGI